jgi:uncharacterized protein (DUF952 family)
MMRREREGVRGAGSLPQRSVISARSALEAGQREEAAIANAPQVELIYKAATRDVVEASRAAGHFVGMPVDVADGYLHFSTGAQLAETLRLWFKGSRGLVLLAVRAEEMEAALRWEASRGGQLFPHVYGTFEMSAVVHEGVIDVDADGACVLPEWVR